ncbi:MAG: methyl-accepting chemotaxis protein [Methanoregula sp.]|nr:methyl-accepting chemotaxis protein [Methanoregula sp.]
MELDEIERILTKSRDGDFSVRVDENKVVPECKQLARMINSTLEKAAEAKELKHRADTMINYNPLAIAILRKDKTRIHINKAYEKAWEGTREELMKKKLYDFDITVLSGEDFYACFTTKKLAVTEAMVKFPNGKKKYLTLNAIPILDKKGEIDGAFYVWVDYTELHEKIDAAREMEHRVDTMIQDNPLAIAVLRKDKSRVSINKQYEIAWRGTNEELMKKKLYDFDIKVLSGEHFYACFETRKLAITEAMVNFPDGVKKYLTLYAIPILDKAGEIDGAFYVWVDYTELHEKMDAVKAMEYRVDTMIQDNPLAIAVLRKDKSRISINKQYEIAWRGSREELMKKKLYDFDITVLSGEDFYACFTTKKLAVTEAMVKFPDGAIRYLTLNAIPILDQAGELDGAFYVWVDYTDAHQKMEEIKQLMDNSQKLSDHLSRSATELGKSMNSMAQGDLRVRAEILEDDPLGGLKTDFNKALDSIQNVIMELEKSVAQMDTTIKDTSRSTTEITKSSEQVAVQTQKSADGAKQQMEGLEKIGKEISDLSASIEEIASTSHTLMDHAQKAATEGNNAAELGKVATTKMKMVEKISAESVTEINALNERMKEISNIVKMIADISSQTNLLALNAAIEAARAGEHGRGFAVVAGEVRNLAGESKTATNQIGELINSIQDNSNKTATAIKSSYNEIQSGIESVNQTIDALNRITTESNVVAQGVTEITKATEDQAEATTRVMGGMEQSRALTRENQDRMEDMAALAEESSASTEEIASATDELASMAERLKKMMDKFKTR